MPTISTDQFVAKYKGKPLNWDGSYGNQCVDLFRFYTKEVWGVKQFPGVRGAKNLLAAAPKGFQVIKNTLWNVPQKGDVMIFDGDFGHVSIYISGNVLWFTSFDQNYPSQGYYDKYRNFIGTGVAHLQIHNYLRPKVLGWIRKI